VKEVDPSISSPRAARRQATRAALARLALRRAGFDLQASAAQSGVRGAAGDRERRSEIGLRVGTQRGPVRFEAGARRRDDRTEAVQLEAAAVPPGKVDESFWRQIRSDWVWGVSAAPFDGTHGARANAAYRRHCARRGVSP
jgi:hypothetical protein